MRRSRLLAIVAAGAVLFLIVSALLARAFSVDSAERSAITAVVQAEARGDAAGAVARITGCAHSGSCRARVTADTRALMRSGAVSIIQIQTSAGFWKDASERNAELDYCI